MKWKWVVVALVVVIVAGLVAWNALRPEAAVAVIEPTRQTIRAFVEEQAVTELPHDFLIAMPIDGWLEPITLREGDCVTAGQIVARLDKKDLLDRVSQAEKRAAVLETRIAKTSDNRLEQHALVEAKATVKAIDETVKASEAKLEASLAVYEFAKSEVERLTKIVEQEAGTSRELREAETEARKTHAEYRSDGLELAALKTIAAVSYIGPKFIVDYIDRKSFDKQIYQQQLDETRSQLEIDKRNLARAEIASPIDGVVLERHQTRRQFLPAGTPLLTLGRLDDMDVIAEVLTERATRIAPDDPVEIFGEAIPDGPVTGRVLRVYPAGFKKISSLGVEQQRVKVAVKMDERPERLGVNFRVYVRIFYDESADALTLPRTAIFRGEDGGWQVMTVEHGVTKLQDVEVGILNDDRVEIAGGLATDAHVLATPSTDITGGMRVTITGQ
jgi:HlyD family secretion protein